MKHSSKSHGARTAYKPFNNPKQSNTNFGGTSTSSSFSYGKYGQTYITVPHESHQTEYSKLVDKISNYQKAIAVTKDIIGLQEIHEIEHVRQLVETITEKVSKLISLAQPYYNQTFIRMSALCQEISVNAKSYISLLMQNRRELPLESINKIIDDSMAFARSCWDRFMPIARTCFDFIFNKIPKKYEHLVAKLSSLFSLENKFANVIRFANRFKIPIIGQVISGIQVYNREEAFKKEPTVENRAKYDTEIYAFFVGACCTLIFEALIALLAVITSTVGVVAICLIIALLICYALYETYKSFADDNHQDSIAQVMYKNLGSPTKGMQEIQQYANELATIIIHKIDEAISFFTYLLNYLSQKMTQMEDFVTKNIEKLNNSIRAVWQSVQDEENNFINSKLGQDIGDFLIGNLP